MSNWSFTALHQHVHISAPTPITREPFNVLALLLLPILCVIGFIGNAMVCIAIATDRRLQNVTNYFLFSLALADLLVCSVVMPLAILIEVRHGLWTWNFSMCLLYAYSDVFLCSASIVHMSMISLDRYMGISRPLKTRNKSRGVVILKIALVWVITLIISSPLAALALTNRANILHDNLCAITNQYYMFYGSTTAFLIPFFIMLITYVKTTHLLNKQAALLSQKSSDRFHNGLRRTMPHRKLGYTRTCSYNMSNGPPTHKPSTMSFSSAGNAPGNGYAAQTDSPISKLRQVGNNSSSDSEDMQLTEKKESTRSNTFSNEIRKGSSALRLQFGKLQKRTSSILTNITTKVSRKSSIQSSNTELANEHKATRVLAVVFICFFICWTPFFIMNFTLAFCGDSCAVPPWVSSVFLWLGYISSTINPIIYTIFNRRFRQAFLRILRCQCMHSIREYSLTYSRHTFLQGETHTYSNFDKPGAAAGRENGRIFTPPSCRQGSRMVGMLISAGLQPVVPTTGASAKIEARSLPSSRQDSPEESDEHKGYISEWSTPIPPKRRSLLPQIRTKKPAILPAGSILSAATAMLQMPANPNMRRSSDGITSTLTANQKFEKNNSCSSSPASPVKKSLSSIMPAAYAQFDTPFVDANHIESTNNNYVSENQTMQISDYDNLHEINMRYASQAGPSISFSEEENSESNESRPLLKQSKMNILSPTKFSLQHTKPSRINPNKPIKWAIKTVPYPNINSTRYKQPYNNTVIKSFTVTEELAKTSECKICERPHSSAGSYKEDNEKLLTTRIVEEEQQPVFFKNQIFLKETYL